MVIVAVVGGVPVHPLLFLTLLAALVPFLARGGLGGPRV